MEQLTQELNNNEIKTALTMLKKLVKNGVYKIAPESTQDLNANVYISSGDISGVYFPNTIIKQDETPEFHTHPLYNFTCLCKYKNELCVCYSLKEFDDLDETQKKIYNTFKNHYMNYIFESLNSLYYTYDELKAVEKLTREINELKQDNDVLKSITFKTKKDGGEFADLLKNIDPEPKENIKIYASFDGYGLKFSMSETHTNKNGDKYNVYKRVTIHNSNGFKSVKDIKETIKEYIESNNEYIKRYSDEIQNIKSIFKCLEPLKKALNGLTSRTKEIIKDAIQHIY